MTCNHPGSYEALPSVPIQMQQGALVITPIFCKECGDVEYRSPPIAARDEDELQSRMEELARRRQLTEGIAMFDKNKKEVRQ